MVKRAFTLIELIFAIIVLAVAFLAIPGLLEITSSSLRETIKDEATFQGIRTAGAIQTYYWDERSRVSEDDTLSYILDTSGDSDLGRYNSTQFRIGNYQLGKKRRFYPNVTPASTTLGAETNETIFDDFDDVDDFNNFTENIQSTITDLQVKTSVFYITDSLDYNQSTLNVTLTTTHSPTTSNIKMIEVNITDTDNIPILTYRTISCNIGTIYIKTRHFK